MKRTLLHRVTGVLGILAILVVVDGLYARNMNSYENDLFGLAKPSARPEKAFYIMSTGNLWTGLTNYGSVGDPNFSATGRPSMMWPGGSDNNYLYDGGIWVGTELGGEPVVTTYFYNPDVEYKPTTGYPGEVGTTVNGAKAKSLEDSYMVFDDADERSESNHVPIGVRINQRGMTWSLPDFDDMVAFEYEVFNTGLNGDLTDVYVGFWYDVDVASIDATNLAIDDLVDYDGWDQSDSDTDIYDYVDPYDLDGDGFTGYDEYGVPYYRDAGQNPNYDPSMVQGDGFYDEWGIVFDADAPALKWQVDVPDLGRVAGEPAVVDGDTLKGYQFPRSVSYIYDGDDPVSSSNDYGEREMNPIVDGFFGGMLLATDAPWQNVEGRDFKIGYSHQWWNWESDPKTDQDRWDYMQGQHVSSQGKKFLNNPLELGFPQFDYRFLLTSGPFDLPEGQSIKLVYVTVIGRGVEGLRANADNAVRAYYSGSENSHPYAQSNWDEDNHWVLPIPPNVPALSYSPVDGGVKLAWDTSAETTPDPNLGREDFEGYQLYRAAYAPQNWELIASFDNRSSDPVWVVTNSGDTLGDAPVDLPGIQQTFTDYGGTTPWGSTVDPPVNSIPYYYALSAYDPVKTAAEAGQDLPRAYSPLSNYKKTLSGAPVPVYPSRLFETGQAIPGLDEVRVVPNPYLGTAAWEALYEDRLKIAGLPPVAKITIYSLAGDRIITIDHTNGTDYEFWDLVSRNNQSVVSGLYIYVVEAPDVSTVGETSSTMVKKVGKFAIFR
ncbi:MAG: hypothetical protein K9N34_07205 [Candidatus Marinimicrobia bacterium]|nr:hypothetical protein [Candidatus Neomarinimicrobiota bacterium]MCF7840435.1 hypothetical protein [Candidatus Neomarinimicrobiota bacterium]